MGLTEIAFSSILKSPRRRIGAHLNSKAIGNSYIICKEKIITFFLHWEKLNISCRKIDVTLKSFFFSVEDVQIFSRKWIVWESRQHKHLKHFVPSKKTRLDYTFLCFQNCLICTNCCSTIVLYCLYSDDIHFQINQISG